MSLNDELINVEPQVLEEVRAKYGAFDSSAESGQREWGAMLRMLERKGIDYRR